MFAWAPKPYHKFMPYKVFTDLPYRPLIVDMTVEEDSRMKVCTQNQPLFDQKPNPKLIKISDFVWIRKGIPCNRH